jgi:uncharacterized membrane protein
VHADALNGRGVAGIALEALPGMTSSPDPTVQNVRAVAELERQAVHQRSRLERLSDRVTETAGSGTFIVAHLIWFAVWMTVNRHAGGFDPFPFSLLNVVVSLEAIVLTSVVLMTQNRMTRQADKRAHLDLQVNLLAEQELTAILQMLYALCQKAGTCARVNDHHVGQLLKETDIVELANVVEKELAPKDLPR